MSEFTNEQVSKAVNQAQILVPNTVPQALTNAFACAGCAIEDKDWPIHDSLEALCYLMAWRILHGERPTVDAEVEYLTHSHAGEWADLDRVGHDKVYETSKFTKYVSVSWHLAGRHTYEAELLKLLPSLPPHPSLIDFGAAPWIQAIYYAKKGCQVTIANKGLESDCNRFGRFLAQINGVEGIQEVASADLLKGPRGPFDIIYVMDVLEHIPGLPDGSPGWIPYAQALLDDLKPGGIWYANAPLDPDTTVHPVSYHPNHWTSPISLQTWSDQHGMPDEQKTFARHKPV